MSLLTFRSNRTEPRAGTLVNFAARATLMAGSVLAGVCLAVTLVSPPLSAKTCSTEALGETVDRIGASLRKLDENGNGVFRPKLAELAKKKKMTMPVAESWVWQNLRDPRITEYDQKIDGLIGDIDHLSDPKDATQNCASIEKLTRAEKQLINLMQQRSDYVLQELDKHIAGLPAQPKKVAKAPTKPAPKPTAQAAPEVKPITPKQTVRAPETPKPPQTAKTQQPAPTQPATEWLPSVAATPDAALEQPPVGATYPALKTTFSVSDISKAGSGVFGNVSSHIAAAINGAFAKFGQPNAYVVGTEGGGAFLAGLRYGKGHVHFTDGTRQKVYWNGPSFGYDLGADGSRVMFLIYNLKSVDQLFIRYPGIEGAAYLAGGVGVTVLGRKGTTIVPIRSGVGLRLGASLAYLRFSPKRRWNPF